MEPARNQQPQPEASLHFLDYWRIIRIRKTIIISVFLLIAITATIVTFILPEQFSSVARIEINSDSTDIQPIGGGQMYSGLAYDPYFIQTEFEKMQSEKVLDRVAEALNLNEVWGKKYNGGTPLKTEDVLRQIKQRMVLATERNTKLIDITVYSEDKKEAADLANVIAVAYQQYRLDLLETNSLNGIRELEKEYQKEQTRIQAAQANLDKLRKDLKVVDLDPNAPVPARHSRRNR